MVVVVGELWVLLGVSYLTPFSSSYPIHLLASFVCGSSKKIQDGRKETKIPLNSNFILEFNDNSIGILCY